jgi:hypothetical protein
LHLLLLLQREIENTIVNTEAAQFLQALLCRDPAQRPEPEAALQGFAWLQPAVNPALQLVQQQARAWPQQRQAALRAAKWMELVQLQKEVQDQCDASKQEEQQAADEAAGLNTTAAAAAAAAAGNPAEGSELDTWGAWDATEVRDECDKAAAAVAVDSGSTDDGWGLEGTDEDAAHAAAADAQHSSSSTGSESSSCDNAASAAAAGTTRMSYSGMLKRGGLKTGVYAGRVTRRDLAPMGAEQHDGW